MKYCLNSTVNKKSLNKADEINIKSLYMGREVEFIDKNIINRYKNKRFNQFIQKDKNSCLITFEM